MSLLFYWLRYVATKVRKGDETLFLNIQKKSNAYYWDELLILKKIWLWFFYRASATRFEHLLVCFKYTHLNITSIKRNAFQTYWIITGDFDLLIYCWTFPRNFFNVQSKKDNTCWRTCFHVFRFIAEPVGTHWYHAHSSALRSDGLSGAFIVLPKQVGCYKTFCSSV